MAWSLTVRNRLARTLPPPSPSTFTRRTALHAGSRTAIAGIPRRTQVRILSDFLLLATFISTMFWLRSRFNYIDKQLHHIRFHGDTQEAHE
jgi:hypothetical protein